MLCFYIRLYLQHGFNSKKWDRPYRGLDFMMFILAYIMKLAAGMLTVGIFSFTETETMYTHVPPLSKKYTGCMV